MSSEPWTLTARWIFPADGPPVPHGTITIQSDRIVAVEPASTRRADEDLGDVAILPGLVNAHTHLDLSDARGKIPPTSNFTAWLSGVIAHRRGQTVEQIQRAIAEGLADTLQCGVTLLGDIAVNGAAWDSLSRARVRAVVFREMIGLSEERASAAFSDAISWKCFPTGDCYPGLSPHSPYSFRAELLSTVAEVIPDLSRITIHLAESPAECELLDRQTGAFLPFLSELGVWDPSGFARNFGQVIESLSGAKHLLLVHCNYLSHAVPIPPNATIVYCPRTHAAFGHPPHPFREFMKRGVRVVLGTDSLASNPDLDILAEARFVHSRHPDLPGETLLRMITLDGAIALGWSDVTGSLTPGKSADLVVLPLPARDSRDPHGAIFDSTLAVRRVMFRGQWANG